MPLRPALVTIHPRGPRPREVRRVQCPNCGDGFEISMRAMSVRCPRCTRPLEFKDVTLKHRVEGDVATMGHVCLTSPSEMVGKLVCGRFTNQGRFEGRATVYGTIELDSQSLTTGELNAKSLRVLHGATLRAKASISPKPRVSPTLRMTPSRPLRRITPRVAVAHQSSFHPIV